MNQVATKKEGALATFDMEADANKGAQNISQEDLGVALLKNFWANYLQRLTKEMVNMSRAQSQAK